MNGLLPDVYYDLEGNDVVKYVENNKKLYKGQAGQRGTLRGRGSAWKRRQGDWGNR